MIIISKNKWQGKWAAITLQFYLQNGLQKWGNGMPFICVHNHSSCKEKMFVTSLWVYLWHALSSNLYVNIHLTKVKNTFCEINIYVNQLAWGNIWNTTNKNTCFAPYGWKILISQICFPWSLIQYHYIVCITILILCTIQIYICSLSYLHVSYPFAPKRDMWVIWWDKQISP